MKISARIIAAFIAFLIAGNSITYAQEKRGDDYKSLTLNDIQNENGKLYITGDDPFIVFPPLSNGRDIAGAYFKISSNSIKKSETFQVFFNLGEGFSEGNSTNIFVEKKNGVYEFIIPVHSNYKQLRIDFPNEDWQYKIMSYSFETAGGVDRSIIAFPFNSIKDELFNHFRNDIWFFILYTLLIAGTVLMIYKLRERRES